MKSGKNVMFTLFNGESFDYIGSSKMMYDMQNNKFPEEITSNDEPKEQWPLIGKNIFYSNFTTNTVKLLIRLAL